MNKLIKAVQTEQNRTAFTENGALSNKSTLDSVLDFFARGGALRQVSEQEVITVFSKAFSQDRLLAVKTAFHFRDVRGGQGEKKTFRTILNWLATNYPEIVKKNLNNIPFFGRFDDVLVLENTSVWEDVLKMIRRQINKDIKLSEGDDSVSLLAKWLPSCNTSSENTRRLAYKIRKFLGWNEKKYRKTLSSLRNKIDVVERKLSSNRLSEIDYETVPSKASLLYRKVFSRNDSTRYCEFLKAVENGEKTIKAATLYPYDIVSKILNGESDRTMEAQWKALPNYCEGNKINAIVVADVSSSMCGLPMAVSISLALYVSERTEGAFKNHFLTFNDTPTLETVVGKTLTERVRNLESANWGGSTNLQSTFDLILNSAIKNKVPQNEMPEFLIIVSDMEFNSACEDNTETNYEVAKGKYNKAGYEIPKIIFWNVNSRNNQFPVTINDSGVACVSGCSPSILKSVLTNKMITPIDVMMETIGSERYNVVEV